ncbi:hypothetical protein K1719_036188 [Acacia pycnantha]|nr:hypothetical protein K1719_036188 [Acacia pycnantha]
MIGWAIELSEFDITYEARHAIKSQALADFLRELTPINEDPGNIDLWKVYVDGSSHSKGSGAGIIIESPEGVTIEHSLQLDFPTSNNQAEYEALPAGLQQSQGARRTKSLGLHRLTTRRRPIDGTYRG